MADKIEYFKDGAVNPDLVTKYAEEYANKFVPPKDPNFKAKQTDKAVTSAQLRRFYGDVKKLEMRLKNSSDKDTAFLEILPLIKLLKAKAAYARKRELVNESFKNWINDNVDLINDRKEFAAFLLYFEAVVGFCYGNGLSD